MAKIEEEPTENFAAGGADYWEEGQNAVWSESQGVAIFFGISVLVLSALLVSLCVSRKKKNRTPALPVVETANVTYNTAPASASAQSQGMMNSSEASLYNNGQRNFVPSQLPNDVPTNRGPPVPFVTQQPNQQVSQYNNNTKGRGIIENIAINNAGSNPSPKLNARRKRGLSYGRLDSSTQERITSVRIQAEQLNLEPFKVYQPPEQSQPSQNLMPREEAAPKDEKQSKEELKKRMQRIAQGAGGGVYATGGKTADLGKDIIEGFTVKRKKKVQTFKDPEYVPQFQAIRTPPNPSSPQAASKFAPTFPTPDLGPPPSVPTKQKPNLPAKGKPRLQAFLDDEAEVADLI